MTVQDVMAEIKQLSLEDRLQLLEWLTRALRDESKRFSRKESSLARVRGLLKTDCPPTDTELAEEYADYLMEKYK
jgi:hypothetical protein